EMLESRNCPTSIWRIASTRSSIVGSCSSANAFPCAHLLSVDLREGRALRVPRALPLGGVPLGDREERGGADLLGDRGHPLDELLEAGARGDGLAALEVDQLAREPVANRAPHVLLEQARRHDRQLLALVERSRAARRQRVAERREALRLAEV